jgi:hypothetical protein
MNIIFEMETSDPDDFLTLLWLADHPQVTLRAVVATPGSRDQCQLIRWALDRCGREDVDVGTTHGMSWWATTDGAKPRVAPFHYRVYGEAILDHPLDGAFRGAELMNDTLEAFPDATILVGSAPKCIGQLMRLSGQREVARWVQQGGFVGDNLITNPLEKFRGRLTCPSYNPGGAPKETLELLENPRVRRRVFVSKNVCHGVVWTKETHDEFTLLATARHVAAKVDTIVRNNLPLRQVPPIRRGLQTMVHGLDCYLADKGVGKAMHDIVAAACAADEAVCTFAEVEIFRLKGEWGARAATGTNTWISTAIDMPQFMETLAQ